VIAGRITDQYGDPLPDARVRVLHHERRGGRRRLVPAGRAATTDDLGQYRVYGLPPGEYFVGATQGEADDGEPVRAGREGHATTYYPGTTNLADAQATPVAVAQEAVADFPLVPARLVTVSGTVVTSSGRLAVGGRVELRPRSDVSWGTGLPSRFSGEIGGDGHFTVGPVAPGTYVIVAEAEAERPAGFVGPSWVSPERETGSAPLTVGPDPLTGATVATAAPGILVGKVEREAGTTGGAEDRLRVAVTPVNADDPEAELRQVEAATVRADGSFELRGLRGRYLPVVFGLPAGTSVKAVFLGTRNVTDEGIEVASLARVLGVRVVLTSRSTELSGTVRGWNGQPVADYVVLVFPANRARWTHPQSRYTRVTRPDQHGRYAISGLPPGDYCVVSLEDLDAGAAHDPEVLERLEPSATRARLAEGEARVLDLELAR
jgi:protocatechuate 3,4-dioxygenase beta subunit